MKISVVSPVYMAENLIEELSSRLQTSLSMITDEYEIILVEDGSKDLSWIKIMDLAKSNKKIKGIKLSRNFGQHNAITCGLSVAKGEWVILIDCDLQDKPEEIPTLYSKAIEGYDIVFAQRENRKDSFFKKQSSKLFYKVFSYMTDTKQDSSIANFGIYNKKVVESVLSMNEYFRYFPIMIQWVGFNSTKIKVQHSARFEGKSTYNFSKLLKLALNNIISYSDKPLKLIVKFGLMISILSFLIGSWYFYKSLTGQIIVMGFSSIIITTSFFSGIIILTLGLVGIYTGKVFEESKHRPNYLIDKKININE